MRENNKKIQTIARETGMLVLGKDNKEYSTVIINGDLELSFEFENPEDMACITVLNLKNNRCVYYTPNDFDVLKVDYPQFFEGEEIPIVGRDDYEEDPEERYWKNTTTWNERHSY